MSSTAKNSIFWGIVAIMAVFIPPWDAWSWFGLISGLVGIALGLFVTGDED